MSLYLYNGGLLVRNGGLASSQDCCCNPPPGACCVPCGEACRAIIRFRVTQTRASTGQTVTVASEDLVYQNWNSWARSLDCSNARGGGAFEWTWAALPFGGRFFVSVTIPCNECGWASPTPAVNGWRLECPYSTPGECQAWEDDVTTVVDSLTITRECDPDDPEGGGSLCFDTTEAACTDMGGVFQGAGTECGYEECGSCCLEPVCYRPDLNTREGPQCLDGYFPSVCQALGSYPCDPAGREPNPNGVYWCIRNITQITITASGHTFNGIDPALAADAALAEQYMNSTYVVQLNCHGEGAATFDMGGGWSVNAYVSFPAGGLYIALGLEKNGFRWCATVGGTTFAYVPPFSGCVSMQACEDGESPALFNVNSGMCSTDNRVPVNPAFGWPQAGDAKYEWTFA